MESSSFWTSTKDLILLSTSWRDPQPLKTCSTSSLRRGSWTRFWPGTSSARWWRPWSPATVRESFTETSRMKTSSWTSKPANWDWSILARELSLRKRRTLILTVNIWYFLYNWWLAVTCPISQPEINPKTYRNDVSRNPSLRSPGVDSLQSVSLQPSDSLVSRYPPLRHGLRWYSIRERRADLQPRAYLQKISQHRMPRSDQIMFENPAARPDHARRCPSAYLAFDGPIRWNTYWWGKINHIHKSSAIRKLS